MKLTNEGQLFFVSVYFQDIRNQPYTLYIIELESLLYRAEISAPFHAPIDGRFIVYKL